MTDSPPTDAPARGRCTPERLLRIFLPLLVLVAGGLAAYWLLNSGPKSKPRRPTPAAALVQVQPLTRAPGRAMVEAFGTVLPTRQIELKARVSGTVVAMDDNFVPGGMFRAGQHLLSIDPADYELAIRQQDAQVAEAEAALALEQGNQDIARQEYKTLGEVVGDGDLELMLRKPQLAAAQARLASARARLAQARLDLERARIVAPYNCVVQSREVNLGARVTDNTVLATLSGTDRYWIEVLVPVAKLHWLRIPAKEGDEGSPARVYDAGGRPGTRVGRVARLAPDLEQQGRMARLLVAVDDPLNLAGTKSNGPKLFIGSYARVEIEGTELHGVFPLDRALLHDGDHLWIMDTNHRLEIRPVEVVFRGHDQVLIAGGVKPGEQVVVTDLAAPVAGMALRIEETAAPAAGAPQ